MDLYCKRAQHNQEVYQHNSIASYLQSYEIGYPIFSLAYDVEPLENRIHTKAAEYKLTLCIWNPTWNINNGYSQKYYHKWHALLHHYIQN